jgi:hypothetical protein
LITIVIITFKPWLSEINILFYSILKWLWHVAIFRYFVKVLSSTSDCIIFLYLGMAVIGEQIWHTGNTLQKINDDITEPSFTLLSN